MHDLEDRRQPNYFISIRQEFELPVFAGAEKSE